MSDPRKELNGMVMDCTSHPKGGWSADVHFSEEIAVGTRLAPVAQQPQAEAVPQFVSCRCFDDVSKRLCADKNRCSQVVAASAAPQQAEAVPQSIAEQFEAMHARGDVWITTLAAAALAAAPKGQP